MYDIYEKCISVEIKPGFKVNDKRDSTESLIKVHVSYKDKDGCVSYAYINCNGKTLKEAEDKIRIRVEKWFNT